MEHPPLFDADDPIVARVRAIALEMPDAVELETWGSPTFRVGKKIFVHLGSRDGLTHTAAVKTDPEEHPALEQDARFFSPPYYDRTHWVATSLAGAEVDWALVAELIETSYRQVALKRQVAALDARGQRYN